MASRILLGFWRAMVGVPPALWQSEIYRNAKKVRARMGFVAEEHRRVQHYCVRELPRAGEPLRPEVIASGLDMPLDKVRALLDELEAGMTFLYRNSSGAVHWAYPVTVDETPHRVIFGSGKQVNAA